jgi:AraC-like DNA-binding protein
VNELMREDRRLFSDSEREKIKEATFLRILAGENTDEDEEVKTILPYRRNMCILAAIDAKSSQLSRIKNYDSRIRLLMWLIEDELKKEGMYPTAMRYEDNAVAIILSVNENLRDFEQVLLSALTMIQTKTVKVMDHTISFAVSSLEDASDTVRFSFGQAKNAMQYRFMKGLESILLYDQIHSFNEYYDAEERLKYIQHCLNSGKNEALVQGVKELAGDIKAKGNISYFNISQIVNQLVTILAQHANENGIHLENLLGDNTGIYQRLWQNLTLEEACDWFCSTAGIVMNFENTGAGSKSEYVRRIMEYVHENYMQCITIDTIADHIGISYSYLRKLYKESTGQNLSDYLNQLRIQKAKQLLLETNYSVKEIVSMCGYNHERSFFRSFTQLEGVSPSKYKELCKNAVHQA